MNESRPFKIALRSVAVWFLIMGAETVNGAFRELIVTPRIGELTARRVSFAIALLLITGITLITIRWIGARKAIDLIGVGALWSLLTFCFEMFLIRPLADIPWERFLADYDPLQGGLMSFGLLFLLFLPLASFIFTSTFLPRSAAG